MYVCVCVWCVCVCVCMCVCVCVCVCLCVCVFVCLCVCVLQQTAVEVLRSLHATAAASVAHVGGSVASLPTRLPASQPPALLIPSFWHAFPFVRTVQPAWHPAHQPACQAGQPIAKARGQVGQRPQGDRCSRGGQGAAQISAAHILLCSFHPSALSGRSDPDQTLGSSGRYGPSRDPNTPYI